jgi:hypothetical protein
MFKNCSEYPASRLSLILASVTGAAVLLPLAAVVVVAAAAVRNSTCRR